MKYLLNKQYVPQTLYILHSFNSSRTYIHLGLKCLGCCFDFAGHLLLHGNSQTINGIKTKDTSFERNKRQIYGYLVPE